VWAFAALHPAAVGAAVGGLLLWTLVEYWVHRVLFHFEAFGAGPAVLFLMRRPPRLPTGQHDW
jgi:hypothetical protein